MIYLNQNLLIIYGGDVKWAQIWCEMGEPWNIIRRSAAGTTAPMLPL